MCSRILVQHGGWKRWPMLMLDRSTLGGWTRRTRKETRPIGLPAHQGTHLLHVSCIAHTPSDITLQHTHIQPTYI
jgi:hypothetical protein